MRQLLWVWLIQMRGFPGADTRGSWTTPEAVHPDRDVGSTDYVAAGVVTAPTYLKWMLLYEEPDNSTVWLAKALPRDWLEASAEEVVVSNATTRYGRVSYRLKAHLDSGGYTVSASVALPASYGISPPAGGVRLRLRTPATYARKLKSVTVGGKPWEAIDAAAETVDFSPSALKANPDLSKIVATFVSGGSDE